MEKPRRGSARSSRMHPWMRPGSPSRCRSSSALSEASDHQHLVIRTLQRQVSVQRIHQIAYTVPGKEWQDRIITLLQMVVRENQSRNVAGVGDGPIVAL